MHLVLCAIPTPLTLAQATGVWSAPLMLWQVLGVLLIAAGAGVLVVVIRNARAGEHAKTRVIAEEMPIRADRSDSDATRQDVERRLAELRSLMQDANELTQLLGARMDEQATRLEELIALADQRLAALESRDSAAPEPSSVRQEAPRPASASPAREIPRDSAREARVISPNSARVEPAETLASRIFELADQGLRPAEIAKRVGQHAGKVELMLALRGRGQQRPARPG